MFVEGCPWRALGYEDSLAYSQLRWALSSLKKRVSKERSPGSKMLDVEVERWDFELEWHRHMLAVDMIPQVLWRECLDTIGTVAHIANSADEMDAADQKRWRRAAEEIRAGWLTPPTLRLVKR